MNKKIRREDCSMCGRYRCLHCGWTGKLDYDPAKITIKDYDKLRCPDCERRSYFVMVNCLT